MRRVVETGPRTQSKALTNERTVAALRDPLLWAAVIGSSSCL